MELDEMDSDLQLAGISLTLSKEKKLQDKHKSTCNNKKMQQHTPFQLNSLFIFRYDIHLQPKLQMFDISNSFFVSLLKVIIFLPLIFLYKLSQIKIQIHHFCQGITDVQSCRRQKSFLQQKPNFFCYMEYVMVSCSQLSV